MKHKKEFTKEKAKITGIKLGIKWDRFNIDQFRRGMNVELEHGKRDADTNVTNDDLSTTGKIALAHLKEFPDYYDRLAKMEKEADKFWS
jgi:hypothetical protein